MPIIKYYIRDTPLKKHLLGAILHVHLKFSEKLFLFYNSRKKHGTQSFLTQIQSSIIALYLYLHKMSCVLVCHVTKYPLQQKIQPYLS